MKAGGGGGIGVVDNVLDCISHAEAIFEGEIQRFSATLNFAKFFSDRRKVSVSTSKYRIFTKKVSVVDTLSISICSFFLQKYRG